MPESIPQYPPLPPDDLQRSLTIAQPDGDETLPHIGIVGDTYTITISGDQTNGRFCVIDMHIPPSRLRGDLHSFARRDGGHLPWQEIDRAVRRYSQRSVKCSPSVP
jgi:hypothetical protein